MPTIPTNKLERAMRAHYLQWLSGVVNHEDDLQAYIATYQAESLAIISRMGGQVASIGALAGFPVPKTLDLSPVAGVVYDAMQQAAISAGITAGLNAKDVARQMLNAGLGKEYKRLERLARTETVSAYWKNAFDSVADLPLIVMVWGAEESKRTCDYCLSRDGLVIEDGNIRDHPNGRCTPIPTLRKNLEYKGTLRPDGSIFMDPAYGPPVAKPTPLPVESKPTATQKDPLSGKSNPVAPSTASTVNRTKPQVAAKAAPIKPTTAAEPTTVKQAAAKPKAVKKVEVPKEPTQAPTANGTNLSNQQKLANAKIMYGTDSPQYRAAVKKYSTSATPKKATPKAEPAKGSNAMNLTNAQRIQNAKIMYGSGSPQHLAALKKYGKK